MDQTGDTRVEFKPDDAAEVEKAMQRFNELVALGYTAAKVTEPGKSAVIRPFDPTATEIDLLPAPRRRVMDFFRIVEHEFRALLCQFAIAQRAVPPLRQIVAEYDSAQDEVSIRLWFDEGAEAWCRIGTERLQNTVVSSSRVFLDELYRLWSHCCDDHFLEMRLSAERHRARQAACQAAPGLDCLLLNQTATQAMEAQYLRIATEQELRAARQAIQELATSPQNRFEAFSKSMELLRRNLTPKQLKQLDDENYFEVVGRDTGARYRILNFRPQNICEVGMFGRTKRVWCFEPEGRLPIGDMLLAQKIALEEFRARGAERRKLIVLTNSA